MKSSLARFLFAVWLPGTAILVASQGGRREANITGEVVDTACYLGHETKGAGHAKCAALCARAGVPLAILESKSGLLYLPVSLDHKNPNEKLLPFVEKRVKVTGVVLEKGGMRGVVIRELSESK
jgi:hypothetical protein